MDPQYSLQFSQHWKFFRSQALQTTGLPFEDVLPKEKVHQFLVEGNIRQQSPVYHPLVTLQLFLWQCLSDDSSMLNAVARLIGHLVAAGKKACSASTGAYCIARQNLPETFCRDVALHCGQELDRQAAPQWLWKGRHVKIIDGTTVSAPDTKKNQAEYPQDCHQKPGVGFPMLRVLVVFSLAVGSALEMAIGPCLGKGTSELAQFRQLRKVFKAGDIAVADRFHSAWFSLALLQEDDVDFVMRKNASRKSDFRSGRRLGKDDHVVLWPRPVRPDWMSVEEYQALPRTLEVREVRLRVTQRGFRVKTIVVVTSLLDPTEYSAVDLTSLYRQRWHAELDLRSLKVTLGMDVLRGKTPAMLRKELWVHLLSYNLVRTVMAQAAVKHGFAPRSLSFKATVQLISAMQPHVTGANCQAFAEFVKALTDSLIKHVVGDRPDRVEPRARKRRPKPFPNLTEPRTKARQRLTRQRVVPKH